MTGDDGSLHPLQEAHSAHCPVATAVAAAAAAAVTDEKALEQHGKTPLQDLGIGKPGVGHVRLHAVGALEALARTRSTGDGIVVLIPFIAESEVVLGALRAGHHTERPVERIGDILRGLHIARHHRCGITRNYIHVRLKN